MSRSTVVGCRLSVAACIGNRTATAVAMRAALTEVAVAGGRMSHTVDAPPLSRSSVGPRGDTVVGMSICGAGSHERRYVSLWGRGETRLSVCFASHRMLRACRSAGTVETLLRIRRQTFRSGASVPLVPVPEAATMHAGADSGASPGACSVERFVNVVHVAENM